MTGSVHWVTGGTRPVESFATIQLQRKQSALLVSDYKRVVQTIERARGPLETDPRFGPQSPKLCVLVCPDSAFAKPMSTLMKKDQTMSGGRRQSRRVLGCDRIFLQGRLVFFGQFASWRTGLSA